MFDEPLLAHPAETGSVYPAWHPHSPDNDDRGQHDDGADDEQHMVLAEIRLLSAYRDPRLFTDGCLCACAHRELVNAVAPRDSRQRYRFAFVRGLNRGMIGHAAQDIPGPPAVGAL